ncbi:MAG TPA: hypothetical protein PK685_02365 [archaeon]|nr:hypothetical protein [archaeon]
MDQKQSEYKWLVRLIFLVVIIIISVFIFIWTGTIRCRSIPGGCEIYWGIMTIVTGRNQPSVLILHDPTDEKGLGNPELLRQLLADKKGLAIHPSIADIRYLNSEQLKDVSLIIVEKARKISTLKLLTIQNYAAQGGRIIWIGDAGIKPDDDDKLYVGPGVTDTNNGWIRLTDENIIIYFNKFIGVNYRNNFCEIRDCSKKTFSGKLITISQEHPLTYGLRTNLPIYDNYAIVKLTEPNPVPLKIEYGSNLFDENKTSYGDVFDAIVTSNSNLVAYYAIPPEYLAEDNDDEKYYSVVWNMFDGMVR